MKLDDVNKLPKESLVSLTKVCMRNLQTLDGLWFLAIEEKMGTKVALECDEWVWDRLGKIDLERLKKAFDFQGNDISTLVKVLDICPSWMGLCDYEVKQTSESKAVLRVTACYPQIARVKKGLGVFACNGMEEGYLKSLASALSPNISVHRQFSPPDKYFENLWCEWHFEETPSID